MIKTKTAPNGAVFYGVIGGEACVALSFRLIGAVVFFDK